MSDSTQPHRQQPISLPHPWDSPGKNIGVGHHFLLQCTKVKSESEAAESYLTLRDPMDCSLPGSSIHGISQARVLEWGAIAFSRPPALLLPYSKLQAFVAWTIAKNFLIGLQILLLVNLQLILYIVARVYQSILKYRLCLAIVLKPFSGSLLHLD